MEKTQVSSRSIEKELFIKATPERVFQALSTKEDLECWFLSKGEIDLRPGGAIRFNWKPGETDFGKILVLDPPHRLSYTLEAPGVTTITFELKEENGGTRLYLTHTGIGGGDDWDRYYSQVSNGWDVHLGNLAIWLETGREKDW